MTCFANPPTASLTRLLLLLIASLMLAPLVSGCGANSTDTGNPPLIDEHMIRVTPSSGGVNVSASAGTVSPGGATVEVENVTTGNSATTTAAEDGSFEVEIAGTPENDYRVVVTANGKSTTVNVGPGSGSNPATDLEGRRFLLESAEGYTPVEDTTLSVNFDDGGFGFSAGCNSHFGDYTLCGGNLCIEGLGSTEIGCDSARHTQDEWLADFFTNEPSLALSGDQLTFTSDEATLVFLDREVANPDRTLTGRTWTVDTFIDGGAASNFPLQDAPTLEFGDDGTIDFYTACNDVSGDYAIDGQEITFSALVTTDAACAGAAAEAEAHLLEVIDGTATFEIEAQRLTLMRGSIGIGATTD